MLSGRRNQYKKAALAAKKKGDIATATKYAKTAKVSSDWIQTCLQIRVSDGKLLFFLFLTKTYVVGTQKNRLNELIALISINCAV